MRALKEAGLSVPGDVSVVGFDDILSAAYCTPSLTTVRQPLYEMGKRGAQVLLETDRQPREGVSRRNRDEPELVVRESTGPAKQGLGARRKRSSGAAKLAPCRSDLSARCR